MRFGKRFHFEKNKMKRYNFTSPAPPLLRKEGKQKNPARKSGILNDTGKAFDIIPKYYPLPLIICTTLRFVPCISSA